MQQQVIPNTDATVAVRPGFLIVRGSVLPVDNRHFPGGQKQVLVRSNTGWDRWGFGFTWQAATDDAYDSGVGNAIPKRTPRSLT